MLATSSMPMVPQYRAQVLWDILDQQVPDIQDQQALLDRLVLQVILVVPELQEPQVTQVAQVLRQDILDQPELQARSGTVEVLVQLP
jgi:hypothetical protein